MGRVVLQMEILFAGIGQMETVVVCTVSGE